MSSLASAACRHYGLWQLLFLRLICLLLVLTSAGARCCLTRSRKPRRLRSVELWQTQTSSSSSSLSLFMICIFKVCVTPFWWSTCRLNEARVARQVTHLSGFSTFILKLLSYTLLRLVLNSPNKRNDRLVSKYLREKTSDREISSPAPDRCYIWLTTPSCKCCVMLWTLWLIQVGREQEYFIFPSCYLKVDIYHGPHGKLGLCRCFGEHVLVCVYMQMLHSKWANAPVIFHPSEDIVGD